MDVKRGPILFRCDGTPEAGFESFYQCLAFAAALQRRRRGTHFLSYFDPLSLAHAVTRGNNDWAPAEQPLGEPGDLAATIKEIRRLNASAVVVMGDAVSPEYLAALRATGTLVIVFDSRATQMFPANVHVSPLAAPQKKAFQVQPGCQLLAGRKFAMVRALFRRQRTIRAQEQPGPFRALVAFGDDDHADQTLVRARQLLAMSAVDKVTLLVRTHHNRFEELKDFADESDGRAEVITEAKEIMTRLVRGHFALSSGDTWSLELCCVGIPQLLLPGTPKHKAAAKRMDDEGIATVVGDAETATVAELKEQVNILLDDPMERRTMSRCARNLVDGRGADRVVNGMEILLHSPSRRAPMVAAAA